MGSKKAKKIKSELDLYSDVNSIQTENEIDENDQNPAAYNVESSNGIIAKVHKRKKKAVEGMEPVPKKLKQSSNMEVNDNDTCVVKKAKKKKKDKSEIISNFENANDYLTNNEVNEDHKIKVIKNGKTAGIRLVT